MTTLSAPATTERGHRRGQSWDSGDGMESLTHVAQSQPVGPLDSAVMQSAWLENLIRQVQPLAILQANASTQQTKMLSVDDMPHSCEPWARQANDLPCNTPQINMCKHLLQGSSNMSSTGGSSAGPPKGSGHRKSASVDDSSAAHAAASAAGVTLQMVDNSPRQEKRFRRKKKAQVSYCQCLCAT